MIKFLANFIQKEIWNEDGQAMTEYVLILMLISIIAVTALTGIGNQVVLKLNEVTAGFSEAP